MPTPIVVVLDNGASSIKADVVSHSDSPIAQSPRIIANAVIRSKGDKKTYYGHEFENCRDFSSLHYRLPFERGFLTDWDAQKAVWDGLLSAVLKVEPPESSLLITEPYFNLPNIQDTYDQFVFEEYEFQSYLRCTPASLLPFGSMFGDDVAPPECMLIVDSGFSFTHVVPVMNGRVLWKSVRRIDVGGKLLTNHLKELVSFRQWNMMDETYIINDVKEKSCYVSTNYNSDLESCRKDTKKNAIVQEYILPNFSDNRNGRLRTPDDILTEADQVLVMNNERFAVPEIVFRPTDIGLAQSGLSRTISDAITSLPQDLQGMFWANIGLVGGNVKFPGFRERLTYELRSLAPIDYQVHVHESSDPIIEAWKGGAELARQPTFFQQVVTRADYQESGSNACRRKFPGWMSRPEDEIGDVQEDGARKVKEKAKAKGKTRGNNADDEGGKKSMRGSRARTAVNK